MNLVILSGRLARDPELTYTPSGLAKARFTIAVNRDFKNEQTGEREADFITCEAWRKQAEFIANNLVKGNRVNVTGSWRTGKYESNGQTVFTNIVNVSSIEPIDWANSGEQQPQQQTPGQQYNYQAHTNSNYQQPPQQQQYSQQQQPPRQQPPQQRQPYNGNYQQDPFAQNNPPIQVSEDDLPF